MVCVCFHPFIQILTILNTLLFLSCILLYGYFLFNLALTFFEPALRLFVSLVIQLYAYCCLNYS